MSIYEKETKITYHILDIFKLKLLEDGGECMKLGQDGTDGTFNYRVEHMLLYMKTGELLLISK